MNKNINNCYSFTLCVDSKVQKVAISMANLYNLPCHKFSIVVEEPFQATNHNLVKLFATTTNHINLVRLPVSPFLLHWENFGEKTFGFKLLVFALHHHAKDDVAMEEQEYEEEEKGK